MRPKRAHLRTNSDPTKAAEIRYSYSHLGFLNVWEGAVRSGKTVIALYAFANYCIVSPEDTFLISGRTVKTIERNAILGDLGLLRFIPGSYYGRSGEARAVIFRAGGIEKQIIVAGAADIRAYMAIRGNSYGGWFADEVNMHDRDFVDEALRRTAVSKDRKHFWTLNPDDPGHWIYTDYIDRYDDMDQLEKEELGGVHVYHWTPDYNSAMTETMLQALRLQYAPSSVQYRRYILGERCVAEGLVYPDFGPQNIEMPPAECRARYASIDFGAVHPTAMGWYGRDPTTKTWYKIREWIATPEQSAHMTTSDYMDVFEDVTHELGSYVKRDKITIDYGGGGEALAREAEKRGWYPVDPDKSVIDGIALVARLLHTGRLKISPNCKGTIECLQMYRWDEKATERGDTKPLKVRDDPADETRYMCTTFIGPRVK